MDQNTNDEQYWINYQTKHNAFQEASLLNIVTEYRTTMYDKLTCYTSPLGGEAYVKEIITSAHPLRCLETFRINLSTFFELSSWLKNNTNLRQSQNHFFVYQKLAIFL